MWWTDLGNCDFYIFFYLFYFICLYFLFIYIFYLYFLFILFIHFFNSFCIFLFAQLHTELEYSIYWWSTLYSYHLFGGGDVGLVLTEDSLAIILAELIVWASLTNFLGFWNMSYFILVTWRKLMQSKTWLWWVFVLLLWSPSSMLVSIFEPEIILWQAIKKNIVDSSLQDITLRTS